MRQHCVHEPQDFSGAADCVWFVINRRGGRHLPPDSEAVFTSTGGRIAVRVTSFPGPGQQPPDYQPIPPNLKFKAKRPMWSL
jgi:hypothetical protein